MLPYQKQVLWSWLANTYHREPYQGHGTGRARDCYECCKIAEFAERFLAKALANPEG